MLKKLLGLLSDAAIYGASSALSQLIGLLLLPIYTRYLDPRDYGVVAMLTLLMLLFEPIGNVGMSNAIFRRFNTTKDHRELGQILGTGLISVSVSALALFVVCFSCSEYLGGLFVGMAGTGRLVQISLVAALLSTVGRIPEAVLRAERRVLTTSVLNIIKLLASIGATIILVVSYRLGPLGVVLGTLVGEVIVTPLQFALTYRSYRFDFNFELWRWMLRYGLPFVPHNIQAVGLMLLGQYIVAHVLGLDEAGLYSVATRLALPLSFVVDSIQKAWMPYKFYIYSTDEEPAGFFRTVVTYYIAGVAYVWLGVSVWGPELLRLLTPEEYHHAYYLIPAVALIAVARGVRFMLGTGIELRENVRTVPLITFAGLVTMIGASFLLVGPWGSLGAALATAMGWWVMAYLGYLFGQKTFPVVYDWPTIISLAVVSTAFVLLGQFSQAQFNLIGRLLIALGLSLSFPAIAAIILLRSPSERARMRGLWSKLKQARQARRQPRPDDPAPLAEAIVAAETPAAPPA